MTRYNAMLAVIAATGIWQCVILHRVLRDLERQEEAREMWRRLKVDQRWGTRSYDADGLFLGSGRPVPLTSAGGNSG